MKTSIKALLGDKYKEGMTLAEAEAVFGELDIHDGEDISLIEKQKRSISDSNAEAADWKKKYHSTLSEADKAKLEQEESTKKLQAELSVLKREKGISENKAKFLALGYSEDLANETAEALFDGNADKVFENQKKAFEAKLAAQKAELLQGTPKPQGGEGDGKITKEQFDKLGYEARVKLYNENPTLYNELSKEN